jgi:hypothetical protein
LIVTKFYEANSAQLEQAAATNEVLRQVTIVFETAAASNGPPLAARSRGTPTRPRLQAPPRQLRRPRRC